MLKILFISYLFLLIYIAFVYANEYEATLSRCCSLGERNFNSNKTTCEEFDKSTESIIENIASKYKHECKIAYKMCCDKERKTLECQKGKEIALLGRQCGEIMTVSSTLRITGNEHCELQQKNICCHACYLGMIAARSKQNCDVEYLNFDSEWKRHYIDCCKQQFKIAENQIVSCFGRCDKVLEQGCHPGLKYDYRLRTCVDVDECKENKHDCNQDTRCLNTIGSFKCIEKEMKSETTEKKCYPGFKYNGETCEDIDECINGIYECPEGTICENKYGSYTCKPVQNCEDGHRLTPDNQCIDIDECSERTDNCNRIKEQCINAKGSYQCKPLVPGKCSDGFVRNTQTEECEDINECELTSPCSENQDCFNTVGSFRCFCRKGFQIDKVTQKCMDVNECQLGLHTCDENFRCINTPGSYTCLRQMPCGSGYTHNDVNGCDDVDECEMKQICGAGYVCKNYPGTYRCEQIQCPLGKILSDSGYCETPNCGPGLQWNSETKNCQDIDECLLKPCDSTSQCINLIGSYKCSPQCANGLQLSIDKTKCEDIDECMNGIARCSSNQECVNTYGSYRCTCPPGYQTNSYGQCEDINECEVKNYNVCPSYTSKCVNTPGSYQCVCNDGFKMNERGVCEDRNECVEISNLCSHRCLNTLGSFVCSCDKGYELDSNGRSCRDIDECSRLGRKLCLYRCRNTQGSFQCECPSGYRLSIDGYSCEDIDECHEYSICGGHDNVCLNTKGSYKCNQIQCPSGYFRDLKHKQRCIRQAKCHLPANQLCSNFIVQPNVSTPMAYSYNFFSLPSEVQLSGGSELPLFVFRGPLLNNTKTLFEWDIESVKPGPNVPAAIRDDFVLREEMPNVSKLYLIKSLKGPQEVKLVIKAKVYIDGLFNSESDAIISLTISEYNF